MVDVVGDGTEGRREATGGVVHAGEMREDSVSSFRCGRKEKECISGCARARGEERTIKWWRGLTVSSAASSQPRRRRRTPVSKIAGLSKRERGKMDEVREGSEAKTGRGLGMLGAQSMALNRGVIAGVTAAIDGR